MEGPLASDRISPELKPHHDFKTAQLNRILAGITDHIKDDSARSVEVTQKFINVAHDRFGPDFPKMKFEDVSAGE